ncbi:hypothetical protein QTA57_08215 [Fontisubflavum oceani]|uniref:hypothetical protein n=1 Tax=Fontisubflavum oceani TaxID=2978973 RepID=UPI0025B4013D|nr:hypothetical protein [Fontisubflavum oceani]WJY23046.1 hypothetical protein QTA57_08215 [Fontisubflavum oceani]
MNSADPLVSGIIGDIKRRGHEPRSLFSKSKGGGFQYVPLEVVLTKTEYRAVLSFFDMEIAAVG